MISGWQLYLWPSFSRRFTRVAFKLLFGHKWLIARQTFKPGRNTWVIFKILFWHKRPIAWQTLKILLTDVSFQMYRQTCETRESLSTIITFREFWCILMKDFHVIFKSSHWFETLSTKITLFGQLSVSFCNVFMKICFHLKFLYTSITNIFFRQVIILNMNFMVLGVVKCLEAKFALQSIAAWFFHGSYASFRRRIWDSGLGVCQNKELTWMTHTDFQLIFNSQNSS